MDSRTRISCLGGAQGAVEGAILPLLDGLPQLLLFHNQGDFGRENSTKRPRVNISRFLTSEPLEAVSVASRSD